MGNCDVWGRVDFGRGPVEVRCTETGEHEQHRCTVDIEDVEVNIGFHNVFEQNEEVDNER